MSSNLVIVIVPNSQRTNDRDVKRLTALLNEVVAKAEGKLYAEFKIDVLSDFQMVTGARDHDHTFILTDGSGKFHMLKKKGLHLKCLECGTDFRLLASMDDLSQYEALRNGDPRGQASVQHTGDSSPAAHPHAG